MRLPGDPSQSFLLVFFFTPLAVFLSGRLTFTLSPLHPHPNLILHPLPQMSQTETAMEAE